MFLKRPTLFSQAGDTIVEVMIVLAVLSLALSISYATANRSLLDTRQAQENSEASELAESQVEGLRTLSVVGDTPNIFQAGPYCLSQTIPYTIPASCDVTLSGESFAYHIAITVTGNLSPPTDTSNPPTFTIIVSWPDVEGQGTNDTVTLSYRLYQSDD
jgi:prepilin-type N-terminal cleavage/methylation domain-containing protein